MQAAHLESGRGVLPEVPYPTIDAITRTRPVTWCLPRHTGVVRGKFVSRYTLSWRRHFARSRMAVEGGVHTAPEVMLPALRLTSTPPTDDPEATYAAKLEGLCRAAASDLSTRFFNSAPGEWLRLRPPPVPPSFPYPPQPPPLTRPTTESAAVGSNTNPYPSEYDRAHLHVLWRTGVQALKLVQGALQEAERSFEEQRVPCPFAGAWLPSNQMSAQTHTLDTRTERHL